MEIDCNKTYFKNSRTPWFPFAKVEVNSIDYPDEPEFETYLLLDAIYIDRPSMTYVDGNRLYKSVEQYAHIKTKYKRFRAIKTDPYFNALQVKFVCHYLS